MPFAPDAYRAPWWLPGGHLQTLFPYFFPRTFTLPYRRSRWESADGDFVDLDWIDGSPERPLIALLHGLEGSSRSPYARDLMHAVRAIGWRGVVVHFRGCSEQPNRLPRAYHSGDTQEVDWILRRLKQGQDPGAPLLAVGVSLGANALLKWLGTQAEAALPVLDAAAAVSTPFDLAAAASALDHGINRLLYTRHFLKTLVHKALTKIRTHALALDAAALARARTFAEFDAHYTAPIHGFPSAAAYWQDASAKPWLLHVRVPTLLLNARNDPFLPEAALPAPCDVSSSIHLQFPPTGGHAGFFGAGFAGGASWLSRHVLRYFARSLVGRDAVEAGQTGGLHL
ncbi:MAG: alpha/beta fold hydrolase [Betaproteobacteria bacterium]|nr:alpha/beta fold hydrolase [Betaproteobacteria bacterium]